MNEPKDMMFKAVLVPRLPIGPGRRLDGSGIRVVSF